MRKSLLLAAAALAAAGIPATPVDRHVEIKYDPRRRQFLSKLRDPLAAERAVHNAAVERKKADKRARKAMRRG
jgi:hypothetical protein